MPELSSLKDGRRTLENGFHYLPELRVAAIRGHSVGLHHTVVRGRTAVVGSGRGLDQSNGLVGIHYHRPLTIALPVFAVNGRRFRTVENVHRATDVIHRKFS